MNNFLKETINRMWKNFSYTFIYIGFFVLIYGKKKSSILHCDIVMFPILMSHENNTQISSRILKIRVVECINYLNVAVEVIKNFSNAISVFFGNLYRFT